MKISKVFPAGADTYRTLNHIAADAGNASMRRAGRTAWNEDDAAAAQDRFEVLVGLYREPGESQDDAHARLQGFARGTWYEGVGPEA